MPLIKVDIEDRHEIVTLENNTDAVVVIAGTPEIKKSKKGNDYLNLRLEIEDEPYSRDIYKILMFPTPGKDSAKQLNMRKLEWAEFFEAFEIDPDAFDLEECKGLTAPCIIGTELDENDKVRNTIKRWSKAKNEGSDALADLDE